MDRTGLRARRLDGKALFEEAVSAGRLLTAWSKVRANAGASGGDGVSISRFERGVERRLIALSASLRDGDYQPGPLREVDIPKRIGGVRRLRIPCIADRVVQTSIHQVLGPHLEEEFEEASFGYRPGRGVRDAVRRVSALREAGYEWLLDADIDDFFDEVDHDHLMARLYESVVEGPLTELIAVTLGTAAPTGRGLPQGSPLSPLLANLYLDRIDEALSQRGLRIVRFADDFVVLTRKSSGADGALKLAERALGELGLKLDPGKTHITSFDKGFRFLGHLFVRSLVLKSGETGDGLSSDEAALKALGQAESREESEAEREAFEAQTRREAGLAAAFRVLYVREPGRRVDIRNTAFRVLENHPGRDASMPLELLAVPHQQVDRIELYPGTSISAAAQAHALATDTVIAHVNGHGQTLGWLAPALAPRAERHLAQAALCLDPDRRLDLARRFVDGRIRNQRAALRRWNRKRADPVVLKAAEALNLILRRLLAANTNAELMGYEGQAAARYWTAFSKCLDHGFTLKQRRAEKPEPVAILLNFASSLLARDIGCALMRAGLHTGFGVLHATSDHADPAIWDVMEEFRAPLCESVVLTLINSSAIQNNHFSTLSDGSARLDRAGAEALIRGYERQAERVVKHPVSGRRGAWRAMMVEQAFALAAHVEGRAAYTPYVMDY